jgi:hypothetical protein
MERRRATNAESCRFESCRGYQIERTWPNGEAPGRQSGDASSILAVRSTLSDEYAGPDGRADGCNPSPRNPAPRRTPEAWALSTSGSAPALQAGWCGFEPRRVHQIVGWSLSGTRALLSESQRSRVRISPGRPVRGSSWRSGRSRSPSKRRGRGFESHRRDHVVATSFNGRTLGSDPGDGGSSPPVAARFVAP